MNSYITILTITNVPDFPLSYYIQLSPELVQA
jgi:hypothetical protein